MQRLMSDELEFKEPDQVEESESLIEADDEGDLQVELTPPTSINLNKNDRSLSEFHRWFRGGRIIIDPEWQRKYVWDRRRASKLIESFLIDLPVPVIYLAINDEGNLRAP